MVRLCWHACDPITTAGRWLGDYPPCDVAHLFQPFPGATAPWLRSRCGARFYDWDDLWTGGLMAGPVSRIREHWPRLCVRYLEQRLPRWADHVTAISGFLADLATSRGARAVTLLHSGSWPAAASDQRALRATLGLRTDAVYAGFMGRTTAELPWCFDALARTSDHHPALRLALCGMPETDLAEVSPGLRQRIDYLGQLTPAQARDFAASLDLALLPMANTPFNESRLPQKFGDYLAAGIPVLCSTVGECARLVPRFPWAIPAGNTRNDWVVAFEQTLELIGRGTAPRFDPATFEEQLSWDGISRQLAQTYRRALGLGSQATSHEFQPALVY
jgi:glycosyltransferase involved in cell wall biosynthesis